MKIDTIDFIKLEKHQTKDVKDGHANGALTVIWRDWDNILQFTPKMIYVSSVEPSEVKGPHLHTKRDSYFVCIRGKVVFVARDHVGKYHEIESSEEEPTLVQIPKNYPSAHINISNKTSSVLALADIAWRPNDNEMENITFDDYDWTKWKKSV
jgi:dTDP-4-dehydrorhamnose 3,5-epimerase